MDDVTQQALPGVDRQVRTIDLNADLGESFGLWSLGHDDDLLPLVTSVNIACGFHAGDPSIMRATVEKAACHRVQVGSHPGFPDKLGFGRRSMQVSAQEIYDWTLYQIGALASFCSASSIQLRHVKPHGSLYHLAVADPLAADAFVRALVDFDPQLLLFCPDRSQLQSAARRLGITVVREGFADRMYGRDGLLVSRQGSAALITDTQQAVKQAIDIALHSRITSDHGGQVAVVADTLCLHGDGPLAVEMATAIRTGLSASGVSLAPPGPARS